MRSATDAAYDHIKAKVMSGDLKAGDRVKEEIIADEIGVSRTPIRNALQRLEAQGYVEMLHHQGARVVNWSAQDLSEITVLRALLEGFGARMAARKITQSGLNELRKLADAMEAAAERAQVSDLEAITDLNSRFHMGIIAASGNRRLAEVIGNLAHPLLIQRRFSAFTPERLRRSMMHHRELIDALSAHDADWAAAVMQAHILASAVSQQNELSEE